MIRCVRCSVLGLLSLHRQVDHSSSSLAHLASVIEPLEFVSGACSCNSISLFIVSSGKKLSEHTDRAPSYRAAPETAV